MFSLLLGQLFLKILTILKKMITGLSVILCGQSSVIHRYQSQPTQAWWATEQLSKGQRATYLWNWNTHVSDHPNEWIVVCITTSRRKLKSSPLTAYSQQARRHIETNAVGVRVRMGRCGFSFLEEKYKHINAQTVPSLFLEKQNKERIPCYSHQILNQEVKEVRNLRVWRMIIMYSSHVFPRS